ncbi:MAG: DUF4019 domain-containing protein, partial [Candidatus Acidiferrum sp.]
MLLSVLLVFAIWSKTAPAQTQQKPVDLAQKSAEAWLALTDSGKYSESWDQASTAFKAAVSQAKWVDMVAPVRSPLGKVISRTLKNANYTKTLPGAPDGEYVVIQFSTSFENKKESVETITPMLDKDGKWRVSGYYIK